MSGNIYTLYKSHCENVGKYRGIEISGVVSSVEISKVESRATLLTLLDLVLHEHRKKFGTPYNQLNGKKALVHLILMKHHWMPKQINEMKFDELLLSIQDELTLDKISVTAQKFLDYRDWRSQIHHFDDFDENEWDPNLSALNRPGFPGECFICELRLPDHRFRWKHNKLFLLLPVGYGPAFPAIVDCYTSPPT